MGRQDDADREMLERLVQHVQAERQQGRLLTEAEVERAYPDRVPELLEALRSVALGESVETSREVPTDATIDWNQSTERRAAGRPRRWLICPDCARRYPSRASTEGSPAIRCPRCHTVLQETRLTPVRTTAHYELLERVGSGGFGSVWRAWDTKLNCQVAFKTPRRNDLSEDEAERFIREARVAAHLRQHPNIVSIHDAQWDGQVAYIVTDFVEGQSLKQWANGRPVEERRAVEMCEKIARALQHAHQAGVIHRDLKPDNVMVDRLGEPHVTDFGLAKFEEEDLGMTVEGQVLGTLAYMAPEQARGSAQQVDRRADVYALGVLLYELLTGLRPFGGSLDHLLQQIAREAPPSPRKWNPALSRDIDTICLKCLEKDPDRRYQTAGDLADELQRVLDNEAIQARPIPAWEHAWRWCQRNPRITWLTLAVLGVALISLAVSWGSLHQQIRRFEARFQVRVDRSRDDFARWVAANAQEKLAEKFRLVRVAAQQSQLRRALAELYEDPAAHKQVLQSLPLGDRPLPDHLRRLQAWLSDDPNWLATGRASDTDRRIGPDLGGHTPHDASRVFSWFVCDRQGYQLARDPIEATLGKAYAYRSYFTGRPRDAFETRVSSSEDGASAAETAVGNGPIWQLGDGPRLSEAFLTEDTRRWVVAISAPVFSPETQEFLGVIGLFIQLQDFSKLIEPEAEASTNSSMQVSLLDPRLDGDRATIIADPTWEHQPLEAVRVARQDLQQHRLPAVLGEGPWRVSWSRVTLPGSDDGLLAVVREREQDWLEPAQLLRRNLSIMGVLILLGSVGLMIPLWILIVRQDR